MRIDAIAENHDYCFPT